VKLVAHPFWILLMSVPFVASIECFGSPEVFIVYGKCNVVLGSKFKKDFRRESALEVHVVFTFWQKPEQFAVGSLGHDGLLWAMKSQVKMWV
jgi:hypothetical protein